MFRSVLIFLIAITGLVTAAPAARGEVAVRLSYGGYTQMDAMDCHDGWGNVGTSWGALNAEVDFSLSRRLTLGPSYTYSSTTTKGGAFKSKITYHGMMVNLRYTYLRNRLFTLYAHAGIGAIISRMQPVVTDAFNRTYFGFQASPLAAELNLARGLSLYGEAGFGLQGMVQVGLKYAF